MQNYKNILLLATLLFSPMRAMEQPTPFPSDTELASIWGELVHVHNVTVNDENYDFYPASYISSRSFFYRHYLPNDPDSRTNPSKTINLILAMQKNEGAFGLGISLTNPDHAPFVEAFKKKVEDNKADAMKLYGHLTSLVETHAELIDRIENKRPLSWKEDEIRALMKRADDIYEKIEKRTIDLPIYTHADTTSSSISAIVEALFGIYTAQNIENITMDGLYKKVLDIGSSKSRLGCTSERIYAMIAQEASENLEHSNTVMLFKKLVLSFPVEQEKYQTWWNEHGKEGDLRYVCSACRNAPCREPIQHTYHWPLRHNKPFVLRVEHIQQLKELKQMLDGKNGRNFVLLGHGKEMQEHADAIRAASCIEQLDTEQAVTIQEDSAHYAPLAAACKALRYFTIVKRWNERGYFDVWAYLSGKPQPRNSSVKSPSLTPFLPSLPHESKQPSLLQRLKNHPIITGVGIMSCCAVGALITHMVGRRKETEVDHQESDPTQTASVSSAPPAQ